MRKGDIFLVRPHPKFACIALLVRLHDSLAMLLCASITLGVLVSPDPSAQRTLTRRAALLAPFAAPAAARAYQTPVPDQWGDQQAISLAETRSNPGLGTQQQAAFYAITQGDLATLQRMIDSGWDLKNAKDSSGKTALHRAAQLGNQLAIEKILKAGVPIDPTNAWEETPLHLATRNGKTAAVKQLVEAGASTSRKTFGGDTPLALATKYRKADIAEFLSSK